MPEPAPDAPFERAKLQFLQGLAHFEASRFEQAESLFRGSLNLLPGRISTLVNLAATLLALGRPAEALTLVEQVLAQEADNQDAEFHRATALGRLQRLDESLDSFERLLALNGQLAEAWSRHGQTLQALDRHAQALGSYQRALALDARLPLAWVNLGSLLRESGRPAEAAHAFGQAIVHGGDSELVRYYLASVTGSGVPAVSPRAYVQSLFDGYAEDFDTHLVQVLGYKTHEILVRHLRALAPGRFDSALDLGCGTGLSGRLVRPLAGRLAGVDLSQSMLDKAAASGVYDALEQADIVEHLRHTPSRHDLVLATDVFIYLGDLAPTFEAAGQAMRRGGIFCFSAEALQDDAAAAVGSPGFELRASLRYAHGERYLRGLAERHGFDVARLLREPLREEQRQAIEGFFVYLRRR
jgi:predicted TPR repeat methyltransferase